MLRKKKETQQITSEAIAAELEKVNLDASTPEEENNFWEKYEEQQEKIEKMCIRDRVREPYPINCTAGGYGCKSTGGKQGART